MSLKNYIILENIGGGTYGDVFKVQRIADGEMVCMKRVNMNSLSVREQEESLMEAKVMSRVFSLDKFKIVVSSEYYQIF